MPSFVKAFAGVAALALMSGTSVAATTPYASGSISPFAVVGAYGSQASAQVLCGAAGASAAAEAAATSATTQTVPPATQGCVLPVPEAAAAPIQTGVPAAPMSFGTFPLIIGLAAIAGLAAFLLSHNDDDEAPPSPAPVSPA